MLRPEVMTPANQPAVTPRIIDFDRPPVAETALGAVFAPISKWTPLHFGLFWDRVRNYYPRTEVKPAVMPAGQTMLQLSEDAVDLPIKALFIDQNGNQLLQVQRNAFIRNWRQTEQTVEYEHYENVRPLFERDWKIFLGFVEEEKLGAVEMVQCEVTYINHLVRGRDWDSFEDMSKIFRVWSGGNVGSLTTSQMVSFSTAYDLPESGGRLQAVVQPGIRKADRKEILQFVLTATIKPAGSDLPEIMRALDAGHVAVVTSFRDFTTPHMHKRWGLK